MALAESEDQTGLVYDIGSAVFRAGIAGDDDPSLRFSALLPSSSDFSLDTSSWSPPIKNNEIVNWDSFDALLAFSVPILQKPELSPLPFIFAEPPLLPNEQREGIVERTFETYNSPATLLMNSGILNLYSHGRTTGLSVEVGAFESRVVPVFEGCTVTHAVQRMGYGGENMGKELDRLLKEEGVDVKKWEEIDRDILETVKKRHSYVPLNFDGEMELYHPIFKPHSSPTSPPPSPFQYELPDGLVISMARDPFFRCVEPLFESGLVGEEWHGLGELTYNSIMKIDVDTRRHWYPNICVASKKGSSITGLNERLQKEVVALAPSSMKCKVLGGRGTEESVWVGGSIVGSLSTFGQYSLSRAEYDEYGPKAVKHKLLY